MTPFFAMSLLNLCRAMKVTQCVLLAIAVVFFAAVNADDLELVPFYKAMSEGDTILLAQNGPFNFTTACDSSAVSDIRLANKSVTISPLDCKYPFHIYVRI